ncbi:MAG TPA: gamma-glutamyl-gamma-aminobutyrate hydrolase family protein [Thermomicrobiales bacterium]|nr:gamma-glutamyl-gamma-aminobutyrate hydrolase family protein [Thermomicrobiales bacterium]
MGTIYIDLEHERVINADAAGRSHRARRDAAQARIEAAAGEPCEIVRFDAIHPDRIRALAPTAIVISGNTTDWIEYDFATLAGLLETIRAAPVPILGICGGHQLIGYAHGAPWGPLRRLEDGEADPDPRFAPGLHKERGFLPIEVDRAIPLFAELDASPVVFQSHYWHLTGAPEGFSVCASSDGSPIQAITRRDRPVFGVQFHPERYDDDHRDGERILQNFFATARRAVASASAQ